MVDCQWCGRSIYGNPPPAFVMGGWIHQTCVEFMLAKGRWQKLKLVWKYHGVKGIWYGFYLWFRFNVLEEIWWNLIGKRLKKK